MSATADLSTRQDFSGMSGNGLTFDGRADRHYVFTYAANMHPAQVAERCSRPVVIGPARLPGHALGFFGHSRVWDGGFATAVPVPGQNLWGVLYELSYMDAQRLDAWQDARLDGAGSYFHYPARVYGPDGAEHVALLYKKDVQGPPAMPSREYLARIVEGAAARGLPEDYVAALRGMASKPAGYPVPDRGTASLELKNIITSCAECGG